MIRRMEAADETCVAALEKEIFRLPWTRAQIAGERRLPTTDAYVFDDGGILGYYFSSSVAGESSLNRIAIALAARRRGLGGRLLRHFLELAMARGSEEAVLEVSAKNDAALILYTNAGFIRVGRRRNYYPEEHADAWILRREIDPSRATAKERRTDDLFSD